MGFIHWLINLLKDPRSAIAGWIAMGLVPTYAFIFLIIFIETGVVFMRSGRVKALTPERLAKTEGMIDKWGPLAVFLGRFFPFIRTFMPFISGISGMKWSRFTPFSVLGGLVWSTLFTLLGYFFGGIPAVQEHFELVIILILLISVMPTVIGLIKARASRGKRAESAQVAADQDENLSD